MTEHREPNESDIGKKIEVRNVYCTDGAFFDNPKDEWETRIFLGKTGSSPLYDRKGTLLPEMYACMNGGGGTRCVVFWKEARVKK